MADRTLLENLRIASPCSASWDGMEGDERVRFCRECRLHVYNLSAMDRAEAEALVREKEGQLCVRMYRRRDGTVLTRDCPVGRGRARRWLVAQVAGVSGVFGIVGILAPLVRADAIRQSELFQKVRRSRLAQVQPLAAFFEWVDPAPQFVVMGAMPGPVNSTPPPPSRGGS